MQPLTFLFYNASVSLDQAYALYAANRKWM